MDSLGVPIEKTIQGSSATTIIGKNIDRNGEKMKRRKESGKK